MQRFNGHCSILAYLQIQFSWRRITLLCVKQKNVCLQNTLSGWAEFSYWSCPHPVLRFTQLRTQKINIVRIPPPHTYTLYAHTSFFMSCVHIIFLLPTQSHVFYLKLSGIYLGTYCSFCQSPEHCHYYSVLFFLFLIFRIMVNYSTSLTLDNLVGFLEAAFKSS